ncbi:MAG: xanthine dehydrogenase accessory factor [Chloroflexota bacterium]|jgi:xanthine dehydrogenase accessory factor|nr:xanthine dehydrogenase accessory factor [Chloroflexota bacterium]
MKELLPDLDTWRAGGAEAARAVVIRTFGSAPRPEGAVMLVSSDGRLAGSVSGGCVEGAAFEEVERARADGRSRVIRYGISDEQAWDVGLACGGTIDVLMQPSLPMDVEMAARELGRAVITPLPRDAPGPAFGPAQPGEGAAPEPPLTLDAGSDSLHGTTGNAATDEELAAHARDALLRGTSRTVEVGGRSYFVEAFARAPRLVIVGAVQVAIPLVALAKTMGYTTVVVDGRPAFASAERFPHADRLIVGWPDEVADEIGLGPDDAVAVLSHDVKFDEPAIVTALARGCRYVGAVGSRKTQTDRRERLRAAGVTQEQLDRLRGPIGLDLGGREPPETALAIMAEVVADRYGASGTPMRHKVPAATASL